MKKTISILLTIATIAILIPAILFLPSCNSDMPDTMLVWALPYTWGGPPGAPLIEEWERAVARAIRERGGNFGVQILTVGSLSNNTFFANPHDAVYPWFTELMIDEINNGTQIDISFVSSNDTTDAYLKMYQEGLTLQLCDFLQSDAGQEIYNIFPPVIWDAMRINGEVHGFFSPDVNFGTVAGYSICKNIANEMDTSLLSSDLVEFANLYFENNIIFNPLSLSSKNALFFDMTELLPGVVLADGEITAFFEHYLLNRYFSGLYNIPRQTFWFETPHDVDSILANTYILFSTSTEETIIDNDYIFYPISETNVSSITSAITINPNSDLIEEALQLLTWLHTDKEFANIFTYGEEGVHIRYEDGMMFNLLNPARYEGEDGYIEEFSTNIASLIGTLYIATPPYFGEWGDARGLAETLLNRYWTFESAPHTGFRFNARGWEDKIDEFESVFNDYRLVICPNWYENHEQIAERFPERDWSNDPIFRPSPLAMGTDPDWETTLANLNADLRAAGIGELIEEVQRQYDEWFALHSPVNR